MPPALGLILTHAPNLAAVAAALRAAKADVLKVVPAWGVDGGWTPAAIAAAAQLAPTLVVRTTWGDPSYAGGARALPLPGRIVEELTPWLAARPDAWIELGNEPLLVDQVDEQAAWAYRWYLAQAISACRAAFPKARLIAPAHTRNHPIRLGASADGQRRWDAICAEELRRCDALGLHAYSITQAVSGTKALREISETMPIWLTEFALNEVMDPAARGHRYREALAVLPAAAACLYHLAASPGADPVHFNPNYQLQPATLAALGAPAAGVSAGPADSVHYPDIRVDGFRIDVRQWRTVDAFRRHLFAYNYRQTAPWARGVVIHHTYRPIPAKWRGAKSIERLASFYRFEVDNGKDQPKGGWTSGPHLFLAKGSPNPADDGIWQMTPLNLPGTHARAANTHLWGLEHVGDFTRQPMPPALAALSYGVSGALLDWAQLDTSPATVSPHAQWGKPACPGRGVDMVAYRAALAAQRGGR